MGDRQKFWTNASVKQLAPQGDPAEIIVERARQVVLQAMDGGWLGPPFDPLELATHLGIKVVPKEEVRDARLVPIGQQAVQIEYNPSRPRARIRFSLAHEIAHTLFPDHVSSTRQRMHVDRGKSDDWQVELLCNLAASEFLMPQGTMPVLGEGRLTIDGLLEITKQYDVSSESMLLRACRLTAVPCAVFAASRMSNHALRSPYRLDYIFPSRALDVPLPRKGFQVQSPTVLDECAAVGYTAKGTERWLPEMPEARLECVGIPPYPGHVHPRVVGVLVFSNKASTPVRQITYLSGDATEPRGSGPRIIGHIVNNKTPRWGGNGFARSIAKKWPRVQRDFVEWAQGARDRLTLGNLHLSPIEQNLWVANMIAQRGYGPSARPRIRYEALSSCLTQLRERAAEIGASVHLPMIGTGYAGGKWELIGELITETLVQEGVEVTVYEQPGRETPKQIQGRLPLSVR